jgi:diaminohydroxyphosphoribosylaminopyrimidine deaminase/5-amino-6-(5-phosphoribosylamino)uracil reductase
VCDARHDSAERSPRSVDRAGSGTTNEATGDYTIDDYFVDRAIDIAWLGAGKTHPNPLVGAVVVKDGRVLGSGYHPRYGEDHAETIALEQAGAAARGSTLYVTLEPCAHHGNTPPCVDHVIRSGVVRVVMSTGDPDERVNGRGVQMLRARGVRVDVGRRAERAMLLNMAYFKAKLGLGPAVSLKIALTLDGKIASAPGRSDEITGDTSRTMAHRLRAIHDGVLVGIDTVLTDSPRLDCRLLGAVRAPVPVVLDSDLRFPSPHPWLEGRSPVVVTAAGSSVDKERALVRQGARVIRCPGRKGSIDVEGVVSALGEAGVSSLLVEGGGRVFSSFLDAGVWDGLFVFVSPALFGPNGVNAADRALSRERIGSVFAGVSEYSGDVLMSFVSAKTYGALRERLL